MICARVPGLLSIVVPVFNESRTIGAVLDRLLTIPLPLDRQIIVVNDGSSDGTKEVLDARPCDERVQITHLPINCGKGRAVRVGLRLSNGSITAIQDADLELDPAQLAELVQPLLDGRADVVYGSRFLSPTSTVPFATRAGNAALTWATNVLYRSALTDMETCYKIMRGDIARSLELTSNRFEIEPEITARLILGGYRIVELPIHFSPRSRQAGKKIRWTDGLDALRVLVTLRFQGGRSRRIYN
jgi:glycosyltransferase involved in cell wall biosynthesis